MRYILFAILFLSSLVTAVEMNDRNPLLESVNELCMKKDAFKCDVGDLTENVVYVEEPELVFDNYCIKFESRHEILERKYILSRYAHVGRSDASNCSDYMGYSHGGDDEDFYVDAKVLGFVFLLHNNILQGVFRRHCLNKADTFYDDVNIFGVYVYKSSVDGLNKYEVKLSVGDVVYSVYFD